MCLIASAKPSRVSWPSAAPGPDSVVRKPIFKGVFAIAAGAASSEAVKVRADSRSFMGVSEAGWNKRGRERESEREGLTG
ncbi:hypothetical protein D3C72_2455560 [compost metagenome]